MDIDQILKLAEKAGGFPLEREFDNTFGFRERALVRFVDMVIEEYKNDEKIKSSYQGGC